VEARSDARNWRAVIIHHSKAEADRKKQSCQIVEVKVVMTAGGGQRELDSEPDDQDCCEGTIEVLAHRVEEAEILREQVVDGLEDELEVIHDFGSFDADEFAVLRHSEVL
jgi:hypothetical protein